MSIPKQPPPVFSSYKQPPPPYLGYNMSTQMRLQLSLFKNGTMAQRECDLYERKTITNFLKIMLGTRIECDYFALKWAIYKSFLHGDDCSNIVVIYESTPIYIYERNYIYI